VRVGHAHPTQEEEGTNSSSKNTLQMSEMDKFVQAIELFSRRMANLKLMEGEPKLSSH